MSSDDHALERVVESEALLVRQRDAVLRRVTRAAVSGERSLLRAHYRDLRLVASCTAALRNARLALPPREQHGYVVSSLFLTACFQELTAQPEEHLVFVTGCELDRTYVLAQRLSFAHQHRTVVGVTGDPADTHRVLIELERAGHRLLAHFHSHPGRGPASTRPSGIDERFQRRLERAGYPVVSAIFSRDGFVRFWRTDDTVTVHVFGSGVEHHDAQTFRLVAASALDRPRHSRG